MSGQWAPEVQQVSGDPGKVGFLVGSVNTYFGSFNNTYY